MLMAYMKFSRDQGSKVPCCISRQIRRVKQKQAAAAPFTRKLMTAKLPIKHVQENQSFVTCTVPLTDENLLLDHKKVRSRQEPFDGSLSRAPQVHEI